MKVYYSESNETALPLHTQTLMKQVISAGLKLHHIDKNAELSLSLVTPEEIQTLNHQYRNKNEPTDVLSFPSEGETIGDIIICLEKATEQASAYNHSLERELAFLTAHGFLHLIGYDHISTADEEDMLQAQKEILSYVGVER